MSPLFALNALGVRYAGSDAPALAEARLGLMPQDRLAVIGESGSGKSTLARAVAGLLPPGARPTGSIDWPQGRLRPGRDIGYVFQDPGGSLDPLLSIGAHLAEVLRAQSDLPRALWPARSAELLAAVRIPQPQDALSAYPHQFSGGQRQRIAIALAIAAGPRLLIADEATSALDVLVQAEIVALLRDLVVARQMALLFVTHDIALARDLADRIAVLYRGRIVEEGPAAQVIDMPRHAHTRALLAAHLDLRSPRLVGAAP